MSDIGYSKRLDGASFDEAVQKITAALAEEGFGILTEIDVQGTLKKKIGAEMERYTILGACNPTLAHQALEADRSIGLLLPCNVVVREVEGGVEVSVASPRAMFGLIQREGMRELVDDAEARVKRALAALR